MSPNPWCWFLLSLFNALAHRFRWRPSTCNNVPYKSPGFFSGFSDIRGSIFLGGRVSGAEMFVLFWEVVWQLQTWILFFSKGIVFFHGSVTNSYGEYTIFGCFPKHPNKQIKTLGGKQTIQSWTCLDHLTDWMFEPFFLGGEMELPTNFEVTEQGLELFVQSSKSESNCCWLLRARELGGLVSTYRSLHSHEETKGINIWVFPKIGVSPQIIHFYRDFYYKPSILGHPYFWKPPFRMKLSTFDGSSVALARNYRTYEKASPKFSPCLKLIITHRF